MKEAKQAFGWLGGMLAALILVSAVVLGICLLPMWALLCALLFYLVACVVGLGMSRK